MANFGVLCAAAVWCAALTMADSTIVLIADNTTMTFDDVEANFAPIIDEPHVSGKLYAANPPDACKELAERAPESHYNAFALVIRGGCQFDVKVRNVQDAGFDAAIIYDNEYDDALITMAGSSSGIDIYAVFVLRVVGEVLKQYAGRGDAEVWIVPTYENSTWSVLAISFIFLLAMSGLLAACFFLRRQQSGQDGPRLREFHGLSSQLVKKLPTITFSRVENGNSTSSTCAICLSDYVVGDKLRKLPCYHKFHFECVDKWLINYGIYCPVCKHDPREPVVHPPPTETTPLLLADSPESSVTGNSARYTSHHPSPAVAESSAALLSKRFDDLGNTSSRYHTWRPVTPYGLGATPVDPEDGSPYILHPENGPPTFLVMSPGREAYPRRYSGASPHITTTATSQSARYSSLRHSQQSEPSLAAMESAHALAHPPLAVSSATALPGL